MSLLRSLVSSNFRVAQINLGVRTNAAAIRLPNLTTASSSSSLFSLTGLDSRCRGLCSVQHCSIFDKNVSALSSTQRPVMNLQGFKHGAQQVRSVTKWSLTKGKRKSVKAVTERFYRLSWGAWIRPMVGRNKRKWSKVAKRKVRAERHVFCNATQSTMLDKMVTNYWRKRRFYIDDIYEPYHIREEYPVTATKPRQC
nr:EOG090X0J5E [Leptodora kindtii]